MLEFIRADVVCSSSCLLILCLMGLQKNTGLGAWLFGKKIGFHHFCLPITGNASYNGPLLVAGFYSLSLWFHLGIGFDPTPLLRFLLGFSISLSLSFISQLQKAPCFLWTLMIYLSSLAGGLQCFAPFFPPLLRLECPASIQVSYVPLSIFLVPYPFNFFFPLLFSNWYWACYERKSVDSSRKKNGRLTQNYKKLTSCCQLADVYQ